MAKRFPKINITNTTINIVKIWAVLTGQQARDKEKGEGAFIYENKKKIFMQWNNFISECISAIPCIYSKAC